MIGQPLSELKRDNVLLWSIDVGRMHSRNNIIVREDVAFLSSSGALWNVDDPKDGVYCIDLNSGRIIWFTETYSDANEISIVDNVLLVGTDSGKVFAIDVGSGLIFSKFQAEEPVYTRAIELERPSGKIGILVSHAGEVIQYDTRAKRFSVLGRLPYGVRANPTRVASASFLVASQAGVITLAELIDDQINSRTMFEVKPHKASGQFDFMLEVRGISSIVVKADRAVVSYARNTYDRRPPIVCFSLKTGEKLWDAGRVQTASRSEVPEFGNSRIVPAVWNNLLLSTFSYNDAVHAFSLDNGKWMWRQRLDDSYFQNWSSPIVQDELLYVARINGVLSVLDLKTRKLLSSYSVEVFESSESPTSVDEPESWPKNPSEFKAGPYPSQKIVAGICSTPAIWKRMILIGTASGKLCCLRPQSSGGEKVPD
ncbi:outer membrane protein assembly factor BamB family protein [Bradyrhizobium sp. AZCC 2289]|uniref:outer membrane protein assembly factor BamB family protein n=1 Tax=Bradyrhizobium sp. AZCC 2289 TaxID=3117026 RepID=UPI002FF15FD0